METTLNQSAVPDNASRKLAGFLPGVLSFANENAQDFLAYSEMMPAEARLWTLGPSSTLAFALPPVQSRDVLIRFELAAFVVRDLLPHQSMQVRIGDILLANWEFSDGQVNRRAIVIRQRDIPSSRIVVLTFHTPNCARPKDLGINLDERPLAIGLIGIAWQSVADKTEGDVLLRLHGRRVGTEARKSFDDKLASGFWSRFITGPNVLDVGFKGSENDVVPIVEGAIGVDLGYPGYDGITLPFADESQDAVYSSHCLEHIPNYLQVIQDWYRVTKVGGHIITVVPNQLLYERKRRPPSHWASWAHQRFYTPSTLLAEFERALKPNSYRVRHLAENDVGYRYDIPVDRHPEGCYEIELVAQKINPPTWNLGD